MSSSCHGVPGGLMRTRTVVPASLKSASATARRAASFSAGATASSRSTMTTSGAQRGTLTSSSVLVPGTNSRLRRFIPG